MAQDSVDMLKMKIEEQKKEIDLCHITLRIYETKLSHMEKENALLKSKNDAYHKQTEETEKDAAVMRMLDTGLDEMVYHLGFCSDVLGDSWMPEYEEHGLAGLKKILRESSKYVHNNDENCSTCDKFIDRIHD